MEDQADQGEVHYDMSDSDEHWTSPEFKTIDLVSRTFQLCNAYIRRSSMTPMSEVGPGLARGMYDALTEWQTLSERIHGAIEPETLHQPSNFILCPAGKHYIIRTAKTLPCLFCEMTSL
jgi:hypothetical protein